MLKKNISFILSLVLLTFISSCASKKAVTKLDDTSQATSLATRHVEDNPKILQGKYEEGVDFFASGNEPFWSVEIYGDYLIHFKTLGPEEDSIKVPMSVMAELKEGDNITYQAQTSRGDFVVKLQRENCQNSMSGKESPYRVEVQYRGKVYKGCGSYLSDSRLEGNWMLEQLNGKEVTVEKKPILYFSLADNKVSGNAGCNSILGSIDAKRNELKFGVMAVTRKACPDMTVEKEVLQLLSKSAFEYRIVDNTLLLFQDGNEVMGLKK